MNSSIFGAVAPLLIAVSIAGAKAEISSIPPEEQEKDHPGCEVVNSTTLISPSRWTKSNNQIDPDMNDTAVGYWLGSCLTWHTTGLHPNGNEKRIGIATLESTTTLTKGNWRLTGTYSTDGASERKVTLRIFEGPVGNSALSKPIALGRGGKISTDFVLPANGGVTLLLTSECHDFVCWGELNHLKFTKQ